MPAVSSCDAILPCHLPLLSCAIVRLVRKDGVQLSVLCRVVGVDFGSFRFGTQVTLDDEKYRASQSFSLRHTTLVHATGSFHSVQGQVTPGNATMEVYSCKSACASNVVLVGPFDGRGKALLRAALLNAYVMCGSSVNLVGSTYVVKSIAFENSHASVARVTTATRICVNETQQADAGVQLYELQQSLLGECLRSFLCFPHSFRAVLLSGKNGAAKVSAINQAAAEKGIGVVKVADRLSLAKSLEAMRTSGRRAVFHLVNAEVFLPAADALSARLLVRTVLKFEGGFLAFDTKRREVLDSDSLCALKCIEIDFSTSSRSDACSDDQKLLSNVKSRVSWSDIGGCESVKKQLRQVVSGPVLMQHVYDRFGLTLAKGILLYGPPGCAKTMIVKALCSETSFSLINVDCAGILSAYVGESEQIIRKTFADARRSAPCIIFFDEVDAIAQRRSAAANDAGTRLLSALLIEMDGVTTNKNICFVGATNLPQRLDSAITRPGRLDHLIFVPKPDESERRSIFSTVLHGEVCDSDISFLASRSAGYSGADIACVSKQAVGELAKGSGDISMLTEFLFKALESYVVTTYAEEEILRFHHQFA